MVQLFHVSEEPGIALFEPRLVPSPDAGVTGDVVWAIDEDHLPNYLLPRDCPRVTFRAGPGTTVRDIAGFFDNTDARRMIVLEQAWIARANNTVLYVYEMPVAPFVPADTSAGYFVSRYAVTPLSLREVRHPVAEIMDRGFEVRYVPDLWPISDGVRASTLDYSIIRMRNAKGRLAPPS
jgi:hypothetical protein